MKMKRPENMSREKLIEGIISVTKRLEKIEAAHKETNRQIAELSLQEELLTGIKKAIRNGQQDMSKFIPKFRELYKLKDERIARLRKEIDAMEKGERLFTQIIVGNFDSWELMPSTIGINIPCFQTLSLKKQ